jgi:GH24 family phage-related lysozyme (muramidase)
MSGSNNWPFEHDLSHGKMAPSAGAMQPSAGGHVRSVSRTNRPCNLSYIPSPSGSSHPPNAITTSVRGRSFIERHEEQRGVSNHLHWPGGAAGVTLGPGYDMRDRSQAEIEQKLRDVGINSNLASRVAAGVGLRGDAARRFTEDNRNLITLTGDQQRRLLEVNLPSYEAIVRRGIHVYLTQDEFNALVSFVYNPGGGWQGVRAAINSGDKREAVRIIEEQVRSRGKVMPGLIRRRHDEAMFLLEGRY